jgi:fermentation-respiration switch protein FrsA (DUF1100 family)
MAANAKTDAAHHGTMPTETRDAMMEDAIGAAAVQPPAGAWQRGRERARQIARQALVLADDGLAWVRAKTRTRNGRRVVTTLTWLGVGALCIYIGAAAVLYFTQRSLMYFPETARTTPAAAGLPQAEEITLTTADGEHLVAWHVPPRNNKPVVLYLHGNGGALRYRAERFERLTTDGIGLVAVEYRGYGGSTGSPSERGLIADGEAAYAFAAAHYQASQIVLWGESLGTGVAVALAAEKPVGRVILEAPFTSAEAVAARRYWFMPVRLLMSDQFRSDARIGKVTAPLLILHGMKDNTVPFAMGQRMFALANKPKRIVRFLDGGHDDLDKNGALIAVGRFLAGDLDP